MSSDSVVCRMCGCAISQVDALIISDVAYCVACKPLVIQRLREGVDITDRVSRNRVIHRAALVSLSVVATMNLVGGVRSHARIASTDAGPFFLHFSSLFGFAIWSLLLWKIWRRPQKWGLGVGIFLLLLIPFQSYLWWLGIHDPKLAATGFDRSIIRFIFVHELPIFIAGVSCTLLRFYPLIHSSPENLLP